MGNLTIIFVGNLIIIIVGNLTIIFVGNLTIIFVGNLTIAYEIHRLHDKTPGSLFIATPDIQRQYLITTLVT